MTQLDGYEPGEIEAARQAAKLENAIVPHPQLRHALQRLRMLQLRSYDLDGKESQPGHLMLMSGDPGSGKSTVLKEHKRRFPDIRDEDGLQITVVLAEMPSPCTKKGVVHAIYRSMGHAAPKDWNAAHIANEIADLARKHRVRLIMLDEADRIFGKETDEIAKFLVSFLNNVKVSVVLAGAREILSLNTGYGLGRRKEADLVLEPYRWDMVVQRETFCAILRTYDVRLGYAQTPVFSQVDVAKRIYVACHGRIGLVTKLIVGATLLSREHDRPVDRKMLGQVWLDQQGAPFAPLDIDLAADAPAKAQAANKLNPFLCRPDNLPKIWEAMKSEEKMAIETRMRSATSSKRSQSRV